MTTMRLSPFVFTKGGIPTEWTVLDMVYNLKLQSSDGGDWSSLLTLNMVNSQNLSSIKSHLKNTKRDLQKIFSLFKNGHFVKGQ